MNCLEGLQSKKTLWVMVLLGFLLIVIPAASGNLGIFKRGECVQIKTILNATWVNISTINYPNSTLAESNKEMSKIGQTFIYNFCNTSELGTYVYDYFDDFGNVYVNEFEITPSGIKPTTAQSGLSIGILLSAIMLMFFFGWLSFKFMEGNGTFHIGIFFLLVSIIISVYGLYLGVVFSSDFLYSNVANVQSKVFIGTLFGLTGIMFFGLLGLVIMTIKELRERKSVQKYGPDWNAKTRTYNY